MKNRRDIYPPFVSEPTCCVCKTLISMIILVYLFTAYFSLLHARVRDKSISLGVDGLGFYEVAVYVFVR